MIIAILNSIRFRTGSQYRWTSTRWHFAFALCYHVITATQRVHRL